MSKPKSAKQILKKNGFDYRSFKLDSEYSASNLLKSMEEYAEQQSDLIFNLFDKPSQKLKPLEDLYRKENPYPDGRFYSPDTTQFYEWIAAKILAISKLTDIEFIKWYSGMEESKIMSAYNWYLSERK